MGIFWIKQLSSHSWNGSSGILLYIIYHISWLSHTRVSQDFEQIQTKDLLLLYFSKESFFLYKFERHHDWLLMTLPHLAVVYFWFYFTKTLSDNLSKSLSCLKFVNSSKYWIIRISLYCKLLLGHKPLEVLLWILEKTLQSFICFL